MKRSIMAAMAAVLVAGPVAAQHGQHGQHGQQQQQRQQQPPSSDMSMMSSQMQRCMDMMTGASPGMLIQHRQELSLSDDQVRRLEVIRTRTEASARTHMQPAMQAHMAAAAVLESNSPNLQTYEARLREAADHMVQVHVALARGAVEARQVLNAEQRTRLATLQRSGMNMGGQQQPGMPSGQSMQPGMHMPCMVPSGQGGSGHGH